MHGSAPSRMKNSYFPFFGGKYEHGERMSGTVVMRWEKGYEEKLVVVTDLDEKKINAAWYQMRFFLICRESQYKAYLKPKIH
jgi:hypothetical protein